LNRVLVVDDDPALLMLVTDVLRDEGFTVLTASNGGEALELVTEQPVDLILLDMRMPVMDGWEFNRAYREQFGEGCAPIVVFTAAMNAHATAEEVGAHGYVAKPFDLDHLVKVVREQVNGPKQA
jgi:two-component system, chemotaxis family, chemotaxis protein CheY